MDDRDLEQLASDWWACESGETFDANDYEDDAVDDVAQLIDDDSDVLPALIRALASGAPEGALSYIGVAILEDMTIAADLGGRVDTTIDTLVPANLHPRIVYEILSGPYPSYLDRWQVTMRFGEVFTSGQLHALHDWTARRNRRLVMSGEGFRLGEMSPWFKTGGKA